MTSALCSLTSTVALSLLFPSFSAIPNASYKPQCLPECQIRVHSPLPCPLPLPWHESLKYTCHGKNTLAALALCTKYKCQPLALTLTLAANMCVAAKKNMQKMLNPSASITLLSLKISYLHLTWLVNQTIEYSKILSKIQIGSEYVSD